MLSLPKTPSAHARQSPSLLGRKNSLFFAENSLLWLQKFPVPLRREFLRKALNLLPEMARKLSREAGFREIPC